MTTTAPEAGLPAAPEGPRELHEIASDIVRWWPRPYRGAVPFAEMMMSLRTIDDVYVKDNGEQVAAEDVVRHFLIQSAIWRGRAARRVKGELTRMLPPGSPSGRRPAGERTL